MRNAWKLGLGQIQALIEATQEVRFAGEGRTEVYEWISRTLEQQQCREQGKRRRGGTAARGKMTLMTRLAEQYMEHGEVKEAAYQRRHFASRYTRDDMEPPAKVHECDERPAGPAGPAAKRKLERA